MHHPATLLVLATTTNMKQKGFRNPPSNWHCVLGDQAHGGLNRDIGSVVSIERDKQFITDKS